MRIITIEVVPAEESSRSLLGGVSAKGNPHHGASPTRRGGLGGYVISKRSGKQAVPGLKTG
jgi:hypothetical protein